MIASNQECQTIGAAGIREETDVLKACIGVHLPKIRKKNEESFLGTLQRQKHTDK